ncbi:hypothetical protein Sjap_008478 [Stephania japonica]|uniref:NAC domain-containing protein n=1 Tax=Stephania japonica TaxID=461633 RepID=A0AAP0JQ88_9MAGN
MGLRDIEAALPPGFRFAPSDEELVCHYLYDKITNNRASNDTMVEVNLHICEPWQLPEMAKLGANEWYFFTFRDRKYSTGFRSNRSTSSGYWKATGKDRAVVDPTSNAVVGMRKTLVFYNGRAPNGIKSGWVMHEFRLENGQMPLRKIGCCVECSTKAKETLTTPPPPLPRPPMLCKTIATMHHVLSPLQNCPHHHLQWSKQCQLGIIDISHHSYSITAMTTWIRDSCLIYRHLAPPPSILSPLSLIN